MRFSKPSPAMVVALIALVFAATGTGIAATGAITGADIQNGSITSADLATGAVTSVDIKNGTVSSTDIKNSTIGTQDLTQFTTTHIVTDSTTAALAALQAKALDQRGLTGATGTSGANGVDGSPGVSWNTVNADFAAGAFTVDRWYGISGPGESTFAAAATTSPTLPGTITDAKVDLLEAPSPDGLSLIEVTLFTSVGTPAATAASCTFNPTTETGCTIPGKVTVPAGARVAWRVHALDGGISPAFDAFKVGLAYTISTL